MYSPSLFSLDKIALYREGNHLEVKSARGGLPHSLWETYSAFANTEGGIIILGISERKDGTFNIEGLEDAHKLVRDFWNMVNNRQKVSCNILTNNMVKIENLDGKDVVVIRIPRAERTTRPVYVGLDPKLGSYRRNGEGDYHCSVDEVSLMMRDAALVTEDTKILKNMDFGVFDAETIRIYRQHFRLLHQNHIWNDEEDEVFMRRIGAMREDKETGIFHPTAAGLLMFGTDYEIKYEFPHYFLDYQENRSSGLYVRWTDRLTSSSGDWSGNVFGFFLRVVSKLQSDLKKPFVLRGNQRVDDTPIHKVVREAMVNMLTNADYYGRRGVVVQKNSDGFVFSNPGNMRVSVNEAVNNNISDPRNGSMLTMLSFLEFGERAGSGLQGIYKTWEAVFHAKPRIEVAHDGVDRTTLFLEYGGKEPDIKAMLRLYDNVDGLVLKEDLESAPIENESSPKNGESSPIENESAPKSSPKKSTSSPKTRVEEVLNLSGFKVKTSEEKVIMLLTADSSMSLEKLSEYLKITKRGIQKIINRLKEEGIVSRVGSKRSGEWIVIDAK